MEVQGVNKGAGGETKPQRLWVLILEALVVEASQFICPQPRVLGEGIETQRKGVTSPSHKMNDLITTQ